MGDYIKSYQRVPEILVAFMGIPESLERHMQFIDTLDDQLVTIIDRFPEVMDMAFDTIEDFDDDDSPKSGTVRLRTP